MLNGAEGACNASGSDTVPPAEWIPELTSTDRAEERGAAWITGGQDEDIAELTEGTCLDPRDLYLSDVRELCQMPWGRLEDFARYIKTQILHYMEQGTVLNLFMSHWLRVFEMLVAARGKRGALSDIAETVERDIIIYTKNTTMRNLEASRRKGGCETLPGQYDKLLLISFHMRRFRVLRPVRSVPRLEDIGDAADCGETNAPPGDVLSDAIAATRRAGCRSELLGNRPKTTGRMSQAELLAQGFVTNFDASQFLTKRTMSTAQRNERTVSLKRAYEEAIRGSAGNDAFQQADAMCDFRDQCERSPMLAWGARGDAGINCNVINPVYAAECMNRGMNMKALQKKAMDLPTLTRRQAAEARYRIRQNKDADEAAIADLHT